MAKLSLFEKRRRRVRTSLFAKRGLRPRLTVHRSGRHIYAQVIDDEAGKTLVAVDPRYFRPTEVEQLLGNPAKAIRELGWDPQQTSFEQLVHKMVDSDLKLVAHKHR